MKHLKVSTGLLALLTLLILLATACAPVAAPAPAAPTGVSPQPTAPPAAAEKIKLSVWKAPHNPKDQDFWNEKLAAYMKDHPNVEVEYRITPWDTWHETYTAAFAGDNPPDISYVVNSFFPKYADAGSLVDLKTLESADLKKWEPLFDKDLWGLGSRDGKQYGIPFLQAGISFVWNKKLFQEAGLDPDSPPKTWDELRTYAQKLTKTDASGKVVQWGYSIMDDTTGEMVNFVPVPIINYGGDLATPDDKKWIATGDGYVDGLQIQADMILKDKTAPPLGTFVGHDIDKAFLDGKIAMQLSYSSFLIPLMKDYADFDMGVGMPPAGPKNAFSFGGVGYWMMASKSQHKKEAWDLIEYLSSGPVMSDYAKLTRLFHSRSDINPFAGEKLMEEFAKTQRGYARTPTLPFDYWGILVPEIGAVLNGQKGASDALDTASKRINDKLAAP